MFFNSHKKSVKEVGNFVKTTFFRPFVLGVEDNFDLSPLFFDNYIFGFIITSVGVSLDRYGAQKWNSTKRGEAIAEAMQIIDPNNILTIGYIVIEAKDIKIGLPNGKKIPGKLTGYDHSSGFGIVSPIIKTNLSDNLNTEVNCFQKWTMSSSAFFLNTALCWYDKVTTIASPTK